MALKSGNYVTKTTREVVVWPAPDANGDGEPVWVERKDDLGRNVGRFKRTDENGVEVRSYHAPDGFVNRPGYDHTDNYVLVDERGEPVRLATGEAVGLKPGQAVVFEPDGTVTYLNDEYAQYIFEEAHDADATEVPKKTTRKK